MTQEDMDAFADLMPWARDWAYNHLPSRDDAEDIAQDAYIRAIESSYAGQASHKGWLCTIMRNLISDMKRKENRGGIIWNAKPGDDRVTNRDGMPVHGRSVMPGERRDPNFKPGSVRLPQESVNPWMAVDSALVADDAIADVSDEDIELVSKTIRENAERLGVSKDTIQRRRKEKISEIKAQTLDILSEDVLGLS